MVDWTAIVPYGTYAKVIARISSRVFVGLPLCRNEEYINFSVQHALTVVKAATMLRLLPEFLKPFTPQII